MKGFKSHHGVRDFIDETAILFNEVIQIFILDYFNKTDQTGKHLQEINIFLSGIVYTAFIHNYFAWKSVCVYGVF